MHGEVQVMCYGSLFSVSARPKNLLVVINPVSGSRSGEKVYYSKVAPLFKQGNIDTEVIGKDYLHI